MTWSHKLRFGQKKKALPFFNCLLVIEVPPRTHTYNKHKTVHALRREPSTAYSLRVFENWRFSYNENKSLKLNRFIYYFVFLFLHFSFFFFYLQKYDFFLWIKKIKQRIMKLFLCFKKIFLCNKFISNKVISNNFITYLCKLK